MRSPIDALLEGLRYPAEVAVHTPLHHLSSLENDELARVHDVWPDVPLAVRRRTMRALADLAESDFEMDFGAVFRLALEDEDAQVRRTAVEALWEDEDVRLVPSLVACLTQDEDASVRAAAAAALGRFVLLGELRRIRPRPYGVAYQSLLDACQTTDEDSEVRRRALESLAYVNNDAVTALISEAYAETEEKVRVSALFAMGRSADRRWAACVQRELSSPNPELRYEGARACGELTLRDAVPELEALADDADPEVQEAALWALGQIGGRHARRILERYCMGANEATRAAAEDALAQLEFLHGDLSDLFARLLDEPS